MPEPKTAHEAATSKPIQRALITYRTKELKADAKWSLWFQREISAARDSLDAMTQFFDGRTWPAMTGSIEVKGVTWPDED